MTWKNPEAFLLFIPLAGVALHYLLNLKKKRPAVQFSGLRHLQSIRKPWRVHLIWLPWILTVFALSGLILALARPQLADTKVKRNVEGIDIMVALDISDSMLIEDMRPENRLEASKKTIETFIDGRLSDRIGLVAFSGEAYTRVPLTLDYPLLKQSLSEVTTTRNIKMGTAIGVALATSVARLKDSNAESRVVIFLTDGENNSGTIAPQTALDIAKGYGVKIYSIGMGKDGQAQLPVYVQDARGRKIKRYRPIHSKVNEALLSQMAQETGGKFWRATTTQGLQEVFNEIDRLEKTEIEVNQYTKYEELFPPYLEWSLGLLVTSLFLSSTFLRRGP